MNFPPLTAGELEFLTQVGKDPADECYVLALRTVKAGWLPAIRYDDFKWMKRCIRQMERLETQSPLVRLKALYVWTLANPPKPQ
jgi:hypothetical protein